MVVFAARATFFAGAFLARDDGRAAAAFRAFLAGARPADDVRAFLTGVRLATGFFAAAFDGGRRVAGAGRRAGLDNGVGRATAVGSGRGVGWASVADAVTVGAAVGVSR